MSAEEIKRSLSSETIKALVLGDQVFIAPVMAGNRPFSFTRDQAEFLIALQKMKSILGAAMHIGKDEEWAKKFLSCRKFVQFRNLKLEESRAKNGITVDYLMQYMKWSMDGQKTWYDAQCFSCDLQEEWSIAQAEACRNDDMVLEPKCQVCFSAIVLTYKNLPFVPSREQNELWKEAAARLWPKVDRVQHQFSKEEFIFETSDESSD